LNPCMARRFWAQIFWSAGTTLNETCRVLTRSHRFENVYHLRCPVRQSPEVIHHRMSLGGRKVNTSPRHHALYPALHRLPWTLARLEISSITFFKFKNMSSQSALSPFSLSPPPSLCVISFVSLSQSISLSLSSSLSLFLLPFQSLSLFSDSFTTHQQFFRRTLRSGLRDVADMDYANLDMLSKGAR
jgi:hypothetical protein